MTCKDCYNRRDKHDLKFTEEDYEPGQCEPTCYPPGSLKKLDEMQYRASRGQDIFSPDDATNDGIVGGRLSAVQGMPGSRRG